MNLFLPDTHAIYWYEFRDSKLSRVAEQVFADAEARNATLVIHPIVLAEFYWLLKKTGQHSKYKPYVSFIQTNPIYRYETLTPADAARLEDFAEIPEMHDRLIAIVAARLGATILTGAGTCEMTLPGEKSDCFRFRNFIPYPATNQGK